MKTILQRKYYKNGYKITTSLSPIGFEDRAKEVGHLRFFKCYERKVDGNYVFVRGIRQDMKNKGGA